MLSLPTSSLFILLFSEIASCFVHDSKTYKKLLLEKQIALSVELSERSQSMLSYYGIILDNPEVKSLLNIQELTTRVQGVYAELDKIFQDQSFTTFAANEFDPKVYDLITKSISIFFKMYLNIYTILEDGLKSASRSKPELVNPILWKVKRTFILSAISAEILCLKMLYDVTSQTGVFINPIMPAIYYLLVFEKGLQDEAENPTLEVEPKVLDDIVSKYSISADELMQRVLESIAENEITVNSEDRIGNYMQDFRKEYKKSIKPLLELNGIQIEHIEL
ncbi:signal peptide containing protein [Theileria equi strain WA]|uniref:Signal peptide containing protein n=1 Tax=Theileria equi strain WA TaxID=1537102 RepID=L1LGH9_THEEQ|nr:signal peptide containing protein [Theileria equi strain WA]EKX74379.1 signal peptide containing protein [Theileria equi strain WA]|eukprot:XP_004833831.1 signal peptide containing protein [Theileria equi strain WA]